MPWPREVIPDSDRLFLRVHIRLLQPSQELHPGIFREHDGSMSVDWERYSTAEESRGRAGEPSANGVVTLVAGEVRSISGLAVEHSPDEERSNRAHSDVLGISTPVAPASPIDPVVAMSEGTRKTMVRAKLLDLCNGWIINPFEQGMSVSGF